MKKKQSAQGTISQLLEQGYTRTDIASKLGVSEITIRRWGDGSNPHRLFVRELKKLLLETQLEE
uniref:Putative DNA binding, helix-turn-helix domain containing protein n=1 Tax=viral metagenome TaxID=1070528 RepID=A0A6M3MB92_9ZZZZ